MGKIKYLVCFILILFMSFGQMTMAQKSLHATHLVYDSAICIRWYPSDLRVWKSMAYEGVIVERRKLFNNAIGTKKDELEIVRDTFVMRSNLVLDSLENNSQVYGLIYSSLHYENDVKGLKDYIAGVEEISNSFLFSIILIHADMEVASNFGLAMVDTDIQEHVWYHYRIFINSTNYTDTIEIFAESGNRTNLNKPAEPKLVNMGHEIQISWDEEKDNSTLYGFHIERSLDGGVSFKQLTDRPIYYGTNANSTESIFIDSTVADWQSVIYRFVALSCFGPDRIISDTAQLFHNDVEIIYPTNLNVPVNPNIKKLQWNFPIDKEKHLSNFEIYKSDSMDGIKQKVGEVNNNGRDFDLITSELGAYYSVVAIYDNGKLASSNEIFVGGIDTIPPSIVSIVYANCDSNGSVSIMWNSGFESDLLGYQVYGSNSRGAEFSNLSNSWLTDTIYTEQLDLGWIRDSVYFVIKTADQRYNESGPSETIALALPKKNKPVTPLIMECHQIENYNNLKCAGSSSFGLNYKLFRKHESGEWLHLSSGMAEPEFNIIDSAALTFGTYLYRLQLTNAAGISSDYSPIVSIDVEEIPWIPKINFIDQWNDTILKQYYFRWNKSLTSIQNYRIILVQHGKTETVGIISGNKTEYVYKYGKLNKDFNFIIVGYTADGRKSKI